MKILMVASEATPYVKTGGLADVLGALPAALVEQGDEVTVLLPRYRSVRLKDPRRIWPDLPIWTGTVPGVASIDEVWERGVRFLFIDCPALYDRAGIYNENGWDYGDNHIRFSVLNQVAVAVMRYIFRPEIVHCHDWQAGLLPLFLRHQFAGDPTFFGMRIVFTIHNLGYQGNFGRPLLGEAALGEDVFRPDLIEFYGSFSFLKAGLIYSDAITTVSRRYAAEIQTPEFGFGMDGLLRSRATSLTGILNGVDYTLWNPETDRHIAANYSVEDLAGKRDCKEALLREMGLPLDLDRPLIGIVSRFAQQKGFDLIAEIAEALAHEHVSVAVLGSGEERYEQMFRHFAVLRPDRFGVHIGYNDALAHRIEAGADIFVMPSRYEPGGLNQLYSLRYGTVPVVRATGGLDDTIDESTGFKFYWYSGQALLDTIRAALWTYWDRERWAVLMRNGMQKDFSWKNSALEYSALYRDLRAGRR